MSVNFWRVIREEISYLNYNPLIVFLCQRKWEVCVGFIVWETSMLCFSHHYRKWFFFFSIILFEWPWKMSRKNSSHNLHLGTRLQQSTPNHILWCDNSCAFMHTYKKKKAHIYSIYALYTLNAHIHSIINPFSLWR